MTMTKLRWAVFLFTFLSLSWLLHSHSTLLTSLSHSPPPPFPTSTLFHQTSRFSGPSFFSNFHYESIPDPTHGFVRYVTREEAHARNLTFVGQFDEVSYVAVDRTEILSKDSWPGRSSVRLLSKEKWEEGSLIVVDLSHAPWGCGTWPALWMTGTGAWPSEGEIDIMENVHLAEKNLHTLHTSPNCRLASPSTPHAPTDRRQTGVPKTNNCDVNAAGQWANEGCGVESTDALSYGKGFNQGGGGVIVMAWERSGIRIWSWGRSNVPGELLREGFEGENVDTSELGVPVAHFPFGSLCSPSHFRSQHLIINIALCGDWAGQPGIWATSGCLGLLDSDEWTCERSVREGKGLEEAYWGIKSIRSFKVV